MVAGLPNRWHQRRLGTRRRSWHRHNRRVRQPLLEPGSLHPQRIRQFYRLLSNGKMPARQDGLTAQSGVALYRRRAKSQLLPLSNRGREPSFTRIVIGFSQSRVQPNHRSTVISKGSGSATSGKNRCRYAIICRESRAVLHLDGSRSVNQDFASSGLSLRVVAEPRKHILRSFPMLSQSVAEAFCRMNRDIR